MTTTRETMMKIMYYFACTHPRRVYATRDFNSQVMADVFEAQDRATLGTALEELVADGVLEPCPPLEYRISDAGLALVRQLRKAKGMREGKLLPA